MSSPAKAEEEEKASEPNPKPTWVQIIRQNPIRCILLFVGSLIVLAGIAALLWYLNSPNRWKVQVAVESATLSRFDLVGNKNLRYNLSLGVSIRNANLAAITYGKIDVKAFSNGSLFSTAEIPAFSQGWKRTSRFYPEFHGEWPVAGSWSTAAYSKEKDEGFHGVGLSFQGAISVRYRPKTKRLSHRTKRYTLNADCALRVPRTGPAVEFKRVRCRAWLD